MAEITNNDRNNSQDERRGYCPRPHATVCSYATWTDLCVDAQLEKLVNKVMDKLMEEAESDKHEGPLDEFRASQLMLRLWPIELLPMHDEIAFDCELRLRGALRLYEKLCCKGSDGVDPG